MILKIYSYNDKELCYKLAFISGSEEWLRWHPLGLLRKKNKTFYLLEDDNGKLIGFCSRNNKGYIADVHILEEFRGKGFGEKLLFSVLEKGNTLATMNPFMMKISEKAGMKPYKKKGRFLHYKL